MKTKILCSLFFVICLTGKVHAQWAVTDPVLTALTELSWAKDLQAAAEQFQVLDKSKTILGESLDLYLKVNGVIKNSKTVLSIMSRQGQMLKISAQECTRNDVYSAKAYEQYKTVVNNTMEESIISFDLLRTIISPNLSMTDGERLEVILSLDTRTQDNYNRLLDERSRFNRVNDAIKRLAALKSVK